MNTLKLFFLLTGLCLFSCSSETKKDNSIKNNPNDIKPMVVDAIIAMEELSSNTINAAGTILANEEVEVKSEVPGKITKIYFKEGSSVTKGQLLVMLNDEDLVAQMQKLHVEIKLQEEKEVRQKQLLLTTAISKEEYDITSSNLNLLKANAQILNTQIVKTRIRAPFGGIIGLKNVSEGAIISSASVIASIQNINPLKLDFSVPEKYNNYISTGTKINFFVAGRSEVLTATVFAKEPKIDPSTRTTRVRASFPNPGARIYPGAFADITIQVGEKSKSIMVPTHAYIPDISGAKMFVSKSGQAISVPVVAGIRTEKEIQILSGIHVGDTILTSGILQLKSNMPVEVNILNKLE
ncbi:MAG: efflux RND transporter periplasmic adaptor subunit [Saprospiraceae bacterium]|nr:efflux RND transporter periplasmic adaptor subunit [Saprospiraceae bacterium]